MAESATAQLEDCYRASITEQVSCLSSGCRSWPGAGPNVWIQKQCSKRELCGCRNSDNVHILKGNVYVCVCVGNILNVICLEWDTCYSLIQLCHSRAKTCLGWQMEHASSNQVLQTAKGAWGSYSTDRQQEIPVFLLFSLGNLARSLSSLQVGFSQYYFFLSSSLSNPSSLLSLF